MKYLGVVVFFIAALSAAPKPQSSGTVDCSQFNYAAGCRSFNEMVTHEDPEVMQIIDSYDPALVCFRNQGDVFILISYKEPPDLPTAPGNVFYKRYEKGISADSRSWAGQWKRTNLYGGEPYFEAASAAGGDKVEIVPASISLRFSYMNPSHTTTRYTMEIRRSTLRSLEKYYFNVGNRPGSASDTGRCWVIN